MRAPAAPGGLGAAALLRECLLQVRLSLPISAAYLLSFALQLTSQIMVGHISAPALAAASLATVYGNASGMAVVIGLTSACETLASQAFGAGNLPRVGAVAQRASAVMLAVCVPCGAAWLAAGPALRAMGQDEATVALATGYIRLQLPGLPAVAVYEVLKRVLQSVDVSGPQVVIGAIAVAFNVALGALLVFATPMGFFGAPLAMSMSQVLMLVLVLLYIRAHRRIHAAARSWQAAWGRIANGSGGGSGGSGGGGGGEQDSAGLAAAAAAANGAVDLRTLDGSSGVGVSSGSGGASGGASGGGAGNGGELAPAVAPKLREPAVPAPLPAAPAPPPAAERDIDDVLDEVFSLPLSAQHALVGWREYLLLGVPSALLLITEWGSFEIGALIAGLISVDALAAHTIIASTAALSFMPPLGLSVAVGIRIGQLCGEVDVARAKLAYAAAFSLDVAFIAANAVFVLSAGTAWATVFTDDTGVVQLVGSALYMLALYSLFDSFQCIAAGGLRGLGLPGVGAAANVVGWACVGVPLAYFCAIQESMGLRGIWVGFTAAVAITFALMTLALSTKDWREIAVGARARALQDKPQAGSADAALGGAPVVDAAAPASVAVEWE